MSIPAKQIKELCADMSDNTLVDLWIGSVAAPAIRRTAEMSSSPAVTVDLPEGYFLAVRQPPAEQDIDKIDKLLAADCRVAFDRQPVQQRTDPATTFFYNVIITLPDGARTAWGRRNNLRDALADAIENLKELDDAEHLRNLISKDKPTC